MTPLSTGQMQAAFDASLASYVEYMASAAGRLRHAVILHHLRVALPPHASILDVGAGLGEFSADLAREGHTPTLVDFSPAMLERARQNCAGLDVAFVCAEASAMATLFPAEHFDAVLCHSLLEFVKEPQGLVAQLAGVLRRPGLLSVVFGNRYHAPLQEIFLRHDPPRALIGLDEELSGTDRFGLPRHLFYPEEIRGMIESSGLHVKGEYGIRVFSDLLGTAPMNQDDLLALELAVSPRPPYRYIARFIQMIAEKL